MVFSNAPFSFPVGPRTRPAACESVFEGGGENGGALIAPPNIMCLGGNLRVLPRRQAVSVGLSMKMEFSVDATCSGTVLHVGCREGGPVSARQDVVVLLRD